MLHSTETIQSQSHSTQNLTARFDKGDKAIMKSNKVIKLILSIAAMLVITILGMHLSTDSVQAHTRCRVDLGFGNWMEGCPHIHTIPDQESKIPVVPSSRKNVYVKNQCYAPIRLALVYKNRSGKWEYEKWWSLDGFKSSLLSSGGHRIVSGTPDFYYYAETTSGRDMQWRGDTSISVRGTQLPMRHRVLSLDGDGDYVLTLTCK